MLIQIDAPSVVLFAGASVLIALALGLALGRHIRGDPAIHWLNAANAFYLVAVVALLARPAISFEMASLLVIAGAYGGMSCAFFAILRAEDRPPPIRPIALLGLAGVAIQAALSEKVASATPLMMTSSTVNSALTLYMALTVWRIVRPRGRQIAVLITLPFGAFFGGYFLRLLSLVIAPDTQAALAITVLIIAILAWSSIVLALGMIALRERQARRALREALGRVEAASAAKSRFLLGVSHELRTPLNGVIGLAELMRSEALGPMPDGYRKLVGGVHENGGRMLDLVTDLLDIASVETGRMALEKREVALAGVLAEIKARLRPEAENRGVRLSVERAPEAPVRATADGERLRRMLTHLAGNAVKYAAGAVTLRLGRAAGGGARFTVEDDGAGMSAAEVDLALELFGRVDGVENAANGSGVGLTLAREIARAHGAALKIESTPGRGTLISVELPPEGEAGAKEPADPAPARGFQPVSAA